MAELTGFEANTLRQIISRTMEQVSAMEAARGRVEDSTQTIASAAQAQAGMVLRQRLTEWQSEYSDIKNKLDILNTQVQTLLTQRTNTDDSTASSAAA